VYRKGFPSFAIPGAAGSRKGSPFHAWDGVGWAVAHAEDAFLQRVVGPIPVRA